MILLNKTYKQVQDNKVKLVYPIQIDEKIHDVYIAVDENMKICCVQIGQMPF